MLRWVVIHKSSANVLPTFSPHDVQIWQMLLTPYADNPSLLQDRSPTLTATELREKLLREKVKALRKSSNKVDVDEA